MTWYDVLFIAFLLPLPPSAAVPIDNGVVGDPIIECGQSGVRLSVTSRNSFMGKVFVKGHYGREGCSTDYATTNSSRITNFSIEFHRCDMLRTRSVCFPKVRRDDNRTQMNPNGVSMSTTVVIQFHPIFLTKIDRAYRIDCFYMQTDRMVSHSLAVSMLPTASLDGVSEMPRCTYTVEGEGGMAVRYVNIGDPIVHTWRCSTGAEDDGSYGMLVHSCFVRDVGGEEVQLVDGSGCSIDPYILGHLMYSSDGAEASRTSHVFKFADSAQLQFTCQIRLCHRAMGTCEGVTPPHCLPLRGRRRRSTSYRRVAESDLLIRGGDMDVDVHTVTMHVIDETRTSERLTNGTPLRSAPTARSTVDRSRPSVCLSWHVLGLLTALTFVCLVVTTVIALRLLKGRGMSSKIEEPSTGIASLLCY